jgi:BAG domain
MADKYMQVRIAEPSSSGRAASPARSAASTSNSTVVPQPASPLISIRAVRSQFSALESGFKFPAILDFDHSELAVTPNNAPVRAYEYALNGLLEQLDAIESDGDEEVRNVRREVVREVEKAVEDVEQKVREQTPQAPVSEVTKEEVNGYEVEIGSEERGAAASEDVLPVKVFPSVKDGKHTLPDVGALASPADAVVDLAIYEEHRSASPVAGSSEVTAAEPDNGGSSPVTGPEAKDAEVADHAFGDPSWSTATITGVTPAVPVPTPTHGSPDPETFLTSMSHDQFTFPPKLLSQSGTGTSEAHDDAVLVEDSSEGEGGSVKGVEDGWSEVDA